MCNFGACINKAKKPGRKRVKIETMYRIEGQAETLNLNFSQLLLISTFVSLQDSLKFIRDSYRIKYGHSFPTETSELHSTRFKSWKFSLFQL